jgi:hypothetical protein
MMMLTTAEEPLFVEGGINFRHTQSFVIEMTAMLILLWGKEGSLFTM